MSHAIFINRKLALVCLGAVVIVIWGFYANEARKEIYFLCSNFAAGTSISSVTSQLNTATLSSYSIAQVDGVNSITQSSEVIFNMARCTITFNPDQTVATAAFTWG